MGKHLKQVVKQESGQDSQASSSTSSTCSGTSYSTKSADRPQSLSSKSSQHVAAIGAANYDDSEQEGHTTGASPISGDMGYSTGEITELSQLDDSIVTEDRPITITDEKSKLDSLMSVETGLTNPDNGQLQPVEGKNMPTSIPLTNVSRFQLAAAELFDTGQAGRVFDDDGYTLEDIQDRKCRESIWCFPSVQCDYNSLPSQLVVGLNTLVVQPHIFNNDDGYTLEDTRDREHRISMGYSPCVQCTDVDFDFSSSQLVVNSLVIQPHRYYDDPVGKPFPASCELLPDVCDTLYLRPDSKCFYAVQP